MASGSLFPERDGLTALERPDDPSAHRKAASIASEPLQFVPYGVVVDTDHADRARR